MDFMWNRLRRPTGRRSGHGSCRDPCCTVDSDRVTKRSTRSDNDPARPDSDTTVQYAPGLTPRLKAGESPWVLTPSAADILRSA